MMWTNVTALLRERGKWYAKLQTNLCKHSHLQLESNKLTCIILQAQQITLTIAQSFNLAFEIWQNASLEKDTADHFGGAENVRVIIGSTDSTQSCSSSASSSTNHNNPVEDIRSGQWVHFDEVDEITDAINSFNMVTLAAPFSQTDKSKSSSRTQQSNLSEHEDLLICLN